MDKEESKNAIELQSVTRRNNYEENSDEIQAAEQILAELLNINSAKKDEEEKEEDLWDITPLIYQVSNLDDNFTRYHISHFLNYFKYFKHSKL